MDMRGEGEGEMYGKSGKWKLTLPYIKYQPMGICCMAQETQTGALYQPSGLRWGGRWEGGSTGRGYMYTYG